MPPSPSDRGAIRTLSAAVDRIWRADDRQARAARVALAPVEGLYRGIVAARGALYDMGVLRARRTALPALSVGNLSVGGTGKTPIVEYVARQLLEHGEQPVRAEAVGFTVPRASFDQPIGV